MRIRQVKPAYWSDEPLSCLSDGARLFYIGLWMLADDAGWLDWSVPEIGAALYPYRSRHLRERQVERYVGELNALHGQARLVIHDCGHAHLPHLTEHQHLPGPAGRAEGVAKRHANDCPRDATPDHAEPRDATKGKVRYGKVVNGKVGVGKPSSTNDDSVVELQRLVADPKTADAPRRAALKTLERMGVSP